MMKKKIHEMRELVEEIKRDLSIIVGDPISKEQAKAYRALLKSLDTLDEWLGGLVLRVKSLTKRENAKEGRR